MKLSRDALREAFDALEYLEMMANGHDYADEVRIMAAADSVSYILHHAQGQLSGALTTVETLDCSPTDAHHSVG